MRNIIPEDIKELAEYIVTRDTVYFINDSKKELVNLERLEKEFLNGEYIYDILVFKNDSNNGMCHNMKINDLINYIFRLYHNGFNQISENNLNIKRFK